MYLHYCLLCQSSAVTKQMDPVSQYKAAMILLLENLISIKDNAKNSDATFFMLGLYLQIIKEYNDLCMKYAYELLSSYLMGDEMA